MTKRKKHAHNVTVRYGKNEDLEDKKGNLCKPTGDETNMESDDNRSVISVCGRGVQKKLHRKNRAGRIRKQQQERLDIVIERNENRTE